MTLQSTDYASLAQASYSDPTLFKQVPIGGVMYTPIAFEDDPKTGFQATAYEHKNPDGSHEVVIAYRGTEFGREPRQDGLTDAGMALAGVNAQTAKSETFTQRVLTLAQDRADKDHHSALNVTVTGHSLGGTLAEINAYKYGLHGETFNAYGAAGLMQGVPAGGHQVIDHVRATDVVSAGSLHFGEVRTYATQQDIDAISRAGYSNTPFLNALPTHAPILGRIQADAHGIGNFVPDPKTHTTTLNAEDAHRAQANAVMIHSYRSDIGNARAIVAVPGELGTLQSEAMTAGIGMGVRAGQATAHAAKQGLDYAAEKSVQVIHATQHYAEEKTVQGIHATQQGIDYADGKIVQGIHATKQGIDYVDGKIIQGVHATQQGLHYAEEKTVQGALAANQALHSASDAVSREASQAYDALSHPGALFNKTTAAPRMHDPTHPDHALFEQVREGVHKLDAQQGRTPDQHSENLAAALTVAAKEKCLNRVDQVALSDDGSKAFAAHRAIPGALTDVAGVETAKAVNTPVEQSTQQLAHVTQQQQAQVNAQQQTQTQNPQQTGPTMTR